MGGGGRNDEHAFRHTDKQTTNYWHKVVIIHYTAVKHIYFKNVTILTLSLLMSYIFGAPCKARNFNVVYIWTYVWQH
jgi:hypothetical protein